MSDTIVLNTSKLSIPDHIWRDSLVQVSQTAKPADGACPAHPAPMAALLALHRLGYSALGPVNSDTHVKQCAPLPLRLVSSQSAHSVFSKEVCGDEPCVHVCLMSYHLRSSGPGSPWHGTTAPHGAPSPGAARHAQPATPAAIFHPAQASRIAWQMQLHVQAGCLLLHCAYASCRHCPLRGAQPAAACCALPAGRRRLA